MTPPPAPGYPRNAVPVDHVERVPRRIRALLGDAVVLDTTAARYVWEWPGYPQFYVPLADVAPGVLLDEHHEEPTSRGVARRHGLRAGGHEHPGAASVYADSPIEGIASTVRFEWSALDHWLEEDEEVFVHPRSPYTRVDALRSTRHVRVERDGVLLADSSAPVMVFETGLPTRYYLDRGAVDLERLVASDTATACPYKGRTSGWWSVRTGNALHPDLAWSYAFPTRELLPIAGLIAFYDEHVDVTLDGVRVPRPRTHFS